VEAGAYKKLPGNQNHYSVVGPWLGVEGGNLVLDLLERKVLLWQDYQQSTALGKLVVEQRTDNLLMMASWPSTAADSKVNMDVGRCETALA
jgi:hypothetical protein